MSVTVIGSREYRNIGYSRLSSRRLPDLFFVNQALGRVRLEGETIGRGEHLNTLAVIYRISIASYELQASRQFFIVYVPNVVCSSKWFAC